MVLSITINPSLLTHACEIPPLYSSGTATTLPTFPLESTAGLPNILGLGGEAASPLVPAAIASQLPPIPPKLTKKILELEFIDMAELVPDAWRFQEEEAGKCCHGAKRVPRRGPVTDIMLWVECYSTLVAVLTTKHPEKAPNLMAYLKTIVKAQRAFHGDGWVSYDMTFRRQAANTKSLDWEKVDFTLFNETFAGRAKIVNRCKFCLSEHHASAECMYAPETKSGSNPPPTPPPARRGPQEQRQPGQVCLLFNNRVEFNHS